MLASILNCRGLLVLVMALEGERLHIVGPEVYAALVTLALLSTMAAAPLFKLLAGRQETA
jgi:Kef-type K+ transport system membrane component KefB